MNTSYTMNGWIELVNKSDTWMKEADFDNDSEVRSPSKTPVLCDGLSTRVFPRPDSIPARNLYYDENGSLGMGSNLSFGRVFLARHGANGTAHSDLYVEPGGPLPWINNVVCFDGHVAKTRLDDMWKFSWHKNWQVPAVRPK